MMVMPTIGWFLRSPSHLAQTGCSPSRATSSGVRFSSSTIFAWYSPLCSVISTIDFGW